MAFGVAESDMGGSSQSTSVKIPAWLQTVAQDALAKAGDISQIGYVPYYGPDVAAMTAPQMAAMQGTNQAAMAFGFPNTDFNSGLPQAQNFNGVSAYSAGGMYDSALEALKSAKPGQYNAIMGQFIDPILGTSPSLSYGGTQPPVAPGRGHGRQSGGGGNGPGAMPSGGANGGYSGLLDMVNGGGAGASGPDFSGGKLSGVLNSLGVNPVGSGGSSGMGGGK